MRSINLVLGVIAILSLSACGEEDVHKYVDEIKKTSAGKIVDLPQAKKYQPEDYTAMDFRSPFDKVSYRGRIGGDDSTPAVQLGAKQAPRPDAARPREFLEHFPLDNFVMVGTLSNKNYSWGLIKDKAGMIHAVRVGEHIGENSGIITSVNDDKIDIMETVPDGAGGWMQQATSLNIRPN